MRNNQPNYDKRNPNTQSKHTEKVRQGCPLSMILYNIGTTPLIEMLNDEKGVTGHITKNIKAIKTQVYADDLTIIINHPNEKKHTKYTANTQLSIGSKNKLRKKHKYFP